MTCWILGAAKFHTVLFRVKEALLFLRDWIVRNAFPHQPLAATPSSNPQDPDINIGICVKTPLSLRTTFTNLIPSPSFTITDNGSSVSGVVYVLISHGETGRGAYLPGGQRLQPLPLAGSDEELNTGTTKYVKSVPNTTMDVNQVGFFDDIVVYVNLQDLIDKAGLKARKWPDVPQ